MSYYIVSKRGKIFSVGEYDDQTRRDLEFIHGLTFEQVSREKAYKINHDGIHSGVNKGWYCSMADYPEHQGKKRTARSTNEQIRQAIKKTWKTIKNEDETVRTVARQFNHKVRSDRIRKMFVELEMENAL